MPKTVELLREVRRTKASMLWTVDSATDWSLNQSLYLKLDAHSGEQSGFLFIRRNAHFLSGSLDMELLFVQDIANATRPFGSDSPAISNRY